MLSTTCRAAMSMRFFRRVQLPRGVHGSLATTALWWRNIHSSDAKQKFRLTYETVNNRVVQMEYAVRGQLPQEAKRIEAEIENGVNTYPFKKVLYCNVGDAHASGQQPLTFVRQLLAACTNPSLMNTYPEDVVERAKLILDHCAGHSIGSYSDSRGIEIIRRHIADFISNRDGVHCSYENVYLVNGASEGIKAMLFMVMGGKCSERQAGVMVPIPMFPLYNAALTELGAFMIGYKLDEDKNWAVNVPGLQYNLEEARHHCEPRIMVVINPGNPTGQYLSVENMKDIIRFCHREGLVLFTDEVYQDNIYIEGVRFQSFHKVLNDMGPEFSDAQIVSFNSTSKGYFGECGIRGGYMQLVGLDKKVMAELFKHMSVNLCPNTLGQVVTDALVNPPRLGDPSYDIYRKEMTQIITSLARKAKMVQQRMNEIPGVQCNEIQGSMEAFPKIDIPEEAWDDARKENPAMELDTYYCLELLRQTGVCVVPGSGFGQRKGTWHFRTTILPPEDELEDMLCKFKTFHLNFLKKYRTL